MSKLYLCSGSLYCRLGDFYPNRLDSGRARRGLLGSSSPFPTSSASLNEALWMMWARWRPRCSRAFSRLREDFLWIPPLVVLSVAAASAASSTGGFRRRSGFRFPARTLGKRQPRPPPLLPQLFPCSPSDSAPGEMTTPSSCRLAASDGRRYWMALLPL